MLAFFVAILLLPAIFGQYIQIESQSFIEFSDGVGEIYLSISLRKADGSADNSNGIKIAFEINPLSSYKVNSKVKKWKFYTTDGCVKNIVFRQNCEKTFTVIIKALGYTSATTNSFTKASYDCWYSTASVDLTSACPYENFILLTQYFNSESIIQPNYSLLIEEFGDSPIIGTTYLSSSTGNDKNTIAFISTGIKDIYSVYEGLYAISVPISILYCEASYSQIMENEETVFKIFSIEITIKKNGLTCENCQGTINLYSEPSTILDGNDQTNLIGLVTNGIASITSLSVIAIGTYDFYFDSEIIENPQKIATVKFNKAKLDISIINQQFIPNFEFSVEVAVQTYDFLDIKSILPVIINLSITPSVAFLGSNACTISNGECTFSNLIIERSGTYQIIVSCSQCDDGISDFITILILYTKIEIVNGYTELSSDNIFEVKFSLYSDIEKSVSYTSNSYDLTLTLSPTINPIYNGKTSNGNLIMNNIIISTEGIYTLTGCITFFNKCDSIILTIKNYYIDAEIIPQNSMTNYPLFHIVFDIYRDKELYVKETFIIFTIEIYTDIASTNNRNIECTTVFGNCKIEGVSIQEEGIQLLYAKGLKLVSWQNSYNFEVPSNKYLKLTLNPIPATTDDIFSLEIGIYLNPDFLNLDCINSYYVIIDVSPVNTLSQLAATVNNGLVQLNGLNLAIEDIYKITAYTINAFYAEKSSITIKNYYLKAILTNEDVTNTDDYFSILVEIFSNSDLTTKFTEKEFSVNLQSDPFVTIIGYNEANVLGSYGFSNLMIQSENTYAITALGYGLIKSNILNIKVKNFYIKIIFSPEPPFTNNTIFTISIRLYEDLLHQKPSSELYAFNILFTPDINIVSPFISVLESGFYELSNLKALANNIHTIKIYGENFITNTLTFLVETCYLNIQFDQNIVIYKKPTYANNIFSVLVRIYNVQNELSTRKWEVFLNLEPNEQLLGASNAIIETGSNIFINLQIQAIGKFKLKASGFDLISDYTEDIDIKICYLKIFIVGDYPYKTEQQFKVGLIFYTDPELITIALDFFDTIELYLNPIGILGGIIKKNCTYLEIFDNLKVLNESNFSISARSKYSIVAKSDIFEIKNYYLNFSFVDPIPVNTESIFSGIVSIFEDIDMNILCLNCSYKIKISIDNNGTLTGNKVGTAIDGNVAFSELRIETENIYTILMKSDRAITGASNNFTIKNYYLHLKVASAYPDIHTKSYFSVEVKIYDGDNIKYESQSYKVELNINPKVKIANYNPIRTIKGNGVFSDLIISEIGDYTFNAYGEGLISSNLTIGIIDCFFGWSFKLVNINNFLIQFDKNLVNPLSMSDFLIKSEKSISFYFQPQNLSVYNFTTTAKETIPQGTEITIEITKKNEIKSEDGFYFDYSVLSINLNYVFIPFSSSAIVQALANSSSTTTKVSTSSSIAVALVSNPSFLWSIMNFLDLISYLPLSSVPYTDYIVTYFTTLGSLNFFPNPAEYLFTVSNLSEPYLEGKRFGFTTSYFLYNSGVLVTCFLISVSLIPIYYLGSRIFTNSIGIKCTRYLKSYKYSFFLRFWIQAYLNIGVLSIVQLRSKYPETLGGIINLGFACICAIMFVLTPPLLFVCSFVSYKSNLLTNSEFKKKWGTLYEEFKNSKGFWSTQFYTLFTLRRLVFVLLQIFLNAGLYIQNSVNLFFCVLQLLFITIYVPYTSKMVMIATLIEEIGILVILIVSYLFICKVSTTILIISETIIIFVIAFIICANTIISFILLFEAIKEFWTKIEEKRALAFLKSAENRTKVHPEEMNITSNESQPTLFKKVPGLR